MKRAYLYCDKRSLNDATNYYVDMVKECVAERGYEFFVTHKLAEIKSPDLIFTITGRYFLYSKLRFPFTKTIYWAQGVGVEEVKMRGIASIKSRIKLALVYVAERAAILKSDFLFLVSDRMKEYYAAKYGYKYDEKRCQVMPCFNLQLSDSFDAAQYEAPTFVYAGSADVWQCVDNMLAVYSLVERKINDARLVILSSNKDIFEKAINEHSIKNYEIKYIPYQLLNEELHKYKYGFLLREDHIVNNVATPTKMNSYLSNYLIPIYSDAVDDFAKNINIGEFTLMARCPLNENDICNMICEFEKAEHDFSNLQREVEKIFAEHYNRERYVRMISSKFNAMNL